MEKKLISVHTCCWLPDRRYDTQHTCKLHRMSGLLSCRRTGWSCSRTSCTDKCLCSVYLTCACSYRCSHCSCLHRHCFPHSSYQEGPEKHKQHLLGTNLRTQHKMRFTDLSGESVPLTVVINIPVSKSYTSRVSRKNFNSSSVLNHFFPSSNVVFF